jgi:hypothetical protein
MGATPLVAVEPRAVALASDGGTPTGPGPCRQLEPYHGSGFGARRRSTTCCSPTSRPSTATSTGSDDGYQPVAVSAVGRLVYFFDEIDGRRFSLILAALPVRSRR